MHNSADTRPVTIAARIGQHLGALGLDPEANALAIYGETPRLVFHDEKEARDFLDGLAAEGVKFPEDIRIAPLDHCHGCGRLSISHELDPAKAPKKCPDCQEFEREQGKK